MMYDYSQIMEMIVLKYLNLTLLLTSKEWKVN